MLTSALSITIPSNTNRIGNKFHSSYSKASTLIDLDVTRVYVQFYRHQHAKDCGSSLRILLGTG